MKLRCIKGRAAHWGSILTEGKYYEVISEPGYSKKTDIITNYEKYWYYTSMQSRSITWIRQGYTQENLHEVMPGYISIQEKDRLYTKDIVVPFFTFRGDDDSSPSFCVLTNEEIIRLGSDISPKDGKPCFCYSVYMLDEYFDYQSIRRDNKLKEILNG